MHELRSFDTHHPHIRIFADARLSHTWQFDFLLLDLNSEVLMPLAREHKGRMNHLWEHTCFEAFIKLKNSDLYWEFNFAAPKAWNVYKFNKYRDPQPPTEDKNFEMAEMSFDGERLSVTMDMKEGPLFDKGTAFEVGFCAVIETHKREKSYWALAHAGERPDFHRAQSFHLVRRVI